MNDVLIYEVSLTNEQSHRRTDNFHVSTMTPLGVQIPYGH